MMNQAQQILLGLVLVLLAGISGSARAAPFEIGVDFELAAPVMTDAWPEDQTRAIAAQIHDNLIEYLNAHVPFWRAGAPWHFSGDVSSTPAVLRFEVVEANNFIKFKIIPSFEEVPQPLEGLSPIDWLKPTDQPPGMESAADVITAQLVELLLEEVAYRSILDRWLQDTVPIAEGAHWDQHSDRLVLALDWNEFRVLRRSIFRLDCRTQSQDPAELETYAIGMPARFDPQNAPSFEALVVAPVRRRLFGDVVPVDQLEPEELRRLQFGYVYLQSYENPGFDDWAIPGDRP